jgi:hypothetical protein
VEPKAIRLTASVADLADVDPVDEPAVYADLAAEQRYVHQVLGGDNAVAIPWELFGDVLVGRRRQADGKPLWTIDIRQRMPTRM